MRKSPETPQSFNGYDKPAKERMIEASHKVFLIEGIHAIGQIAHLAGSNLDTFLRYFGRGDALIEHFIDAQIAEAEGIWEGITTDHPNQPETQLRQWLAMADGTIGGEIDHLLGPEVTLSRTAAELPWHPKHALLVKIEDYWQAERRRVLKLCRDARLRKPFGGVRQADPSRPWRAQPPNSLRPPQAHASPGRGGRGYPCSTRPHQPTAGGSDSRLERVK